MRLTGALLIFALALGAGCTNFKHEVRDETALSGPAKGDLGRELEVRIDGADDALVSQFMEAMKADLELGDLFDEVEPARSTAPVGSHSRAARHVPALHGSRAAVVPYFGRQRDGYVARYELTCSLTDRAGTEVVAGSVTGIGFDDATDPDRLKESKKGEIRAAARRDAALKIGRFLRRAAEEKANEALKAIEKVRLPPGVGPIRVAVIGFDDDPAARRRRGPQMTRALALALQRLGPDFDIVSPEEVEQELGSDPMSRPPSYEKIREEHLGRMIPRLGMRLYVAGRVSADGNRIEASSSIRPTRAEAEAIGSASGAAEGPGALSLVAIEMAKQLGAAVKAKPPLPLPKKDEND